MAFTKSVIFWEESSEQKDTVRDTSLLAQAKTALDSAGNAIEGAIDKGVSAIKETLHMEDDAKDNSPSIYKSEVYRTLSLNCVLSETHQFSNEVTSYPISDGFQISEHVIRRNPTFSLQGWITDVSMPDTIVSFATVGKIAGSMVARGGNPVIGSLLGSSGTVLDNLLIDDNSPVKDGFQQIKDLIKDGTMVHVATILGTYENCILRSASISQNVTNSSILPVNLSFEKIYTISKNGSFDYINPILEAELEKVTNDTTGNFLDDAMGMLKKQGVNIANAIMGTS